MNRVRRLPLPEVRYYVQARYPALLGGGESWRGPFKSDHEARKVATAMASPYPGQYAPGLRILRVECRNAR